MTHYDSATGLVKGKFDIRFQENKDGPRSVHFRRGKLNFLLGKKQTTQHKSTYTTGLEECYNGHIAIRVLLKNITIMKIFPVLLVLFCLTGCHKSEVEPEEVKATIINYTVGFVACSGGYTLQMENDGLYRTFTLPEPYNDASKLKLPVSVWIRYKTPTGSCSQTTGLIDVTAVRTQ